MATYFALACFECKKKTAFVRNSGALMNGAAEAIPIFMGRHLYCGDERPRIISEYHDLYDEMEFDPAKPD